MQPQLIRWLATASLCAAAALAQAGPVEDAIRAGGVALLIRHASVPGVGDPEQFKLDDCATGRNLSEAGRDEALRKSSARSNQPRCNDCGAMK